MSLRPLTATAIEFRAAVEEQIVAFRSTALIRRVSEGSVTLFHYHAILTTLFHQTYNSPDAFAKAAANCSWKHAVAKEYLLRHAEEERTHWRWVLNDFCLCYSKATSAGLTSQGIIGKWVTCSVF